MMNRSGRSAGGSVPLPPALAQGLGAPGTARGVRVGPVPRVLPAPLPAPLEPTDAEQPNLRRPALDHAGDAVFITAASRSIRRGRASRTPTRPASA